MKTCKHCGIAESTEVKFNGLACNTCKNGLDRYSLTRLDMKEMFEKQDGKCKLCDKEIQLFTRRKPNSAYVDHNHTTGEVRSLLCHPCNTALGYIENNLSVERLKEYLRVAQLD